MIIVPSNSFSYNMTPILFEFAICSASTWQQRPCLAMLLSAIHQTMRPPKKPLHGGISTCSCCELSNTAEKYLWSRRLRSSMQKFNNSY